LKLLIFTPFWQRPEITRIYIAGISRLAKLQDFDIQVFAIVSPEDETENKDLLNEAGYIVYEYKNFPLGEKKNAGIKEALKYDFDYLMELNSDDVVKDDLLKLYKKDMENKIPFLAITNFVFVNSATGEIKEIRGRTIYGIGRAYRKDILFEMWPADLNRGMDNWSEFNLQQKGFIPKKHTTERPLALDIKSDVNIWSYDEVKGNPTDREIALEGLSQEEKELIDVLKL